MDRIESEFVVNRAKDNPFVAGGLRTYREYRDLGIGKATGGRGHAHVIRTTKPCPEGGSGLHYHDVEFQMVMVLRGTSTVWFEGQGEVTFEAGDCWAAPGTTFTRTITRRSRSRFPRKTVQLEA